MGRIKTGMISSAGLLFPPDGPKRLLDEKGRNLKVPEFRYLSSRLVYYMVTEIIRGRVGNVLVGAG